MLQSVIPNSRSIFGQYKTVLPKEGVQEEINTMNDCVDARITRKYFQTGNTHKKNFGRNECTKRIALYVVVRGDRLQDECAGTLDRRRDTYTLLSNIIVVVVIITTESYTRSADDGFVPSMGYRRGGESHENDDPIT